MTRARTTPVTTRLLVAAALLSGTAEASARESAIYLEASYSGEVWHNARGGIDSGSAYLDNLGVAARIDAEALWGIAGTRVLLEGLYNNGNPLSPNLVGDLQTASNIESGPNEARLYQALVTTQLGNDGSLRAGLYDVNSEFDVLDAANLFINSAHGIGTDIGQTGRNGPSIFPLTSLGVRLAWRWSDAWQGRVAVLDGVPGRRDAPNEMGVALGDGDGAFVIAELERSAGGTTVLAGSWFYTAAFDPWDTGEPGSADTARGNRGVYLRGEWQLRPGMAVFARYGWARGRFNPTEHFIGAGATWQPAGGFMDTLGVAIAWAEASDGYRQSGQVAGPAAPREVALELTYRVELSERAALQPDVQWIRNPGLAADRDDALVFGLRLDLTLP